MLWVNILTSWFAAGRPLAEYLNPFAAPPVASDQAAAGAVKSPRQAPRPAVPQ
jgi:hypothetical protein